MSEFNFLSFLQQLLTMVDPKNPYSIATAKTALESVCTLANESGKAGAVVIREMDAAIHIFERLVDHREDFAGRAGEIDENKNKRARLRNVLFPSC